MDAFHLQWMYIPAGGLLCTGMPNNMAPSDLDTAARLSVSALFAAMTPSGGLQHRNGKWLPRYGVRNR